MNTHFKNTQTQIGIVQRHKNTNADKNKHKHRLSKTDKHRNELHKNIHKQTQIRIHTFKNTKIQIDKHRYTKTKQRHRHTFKDKIVSAKADLGSLDLTLYLTKRQPVSYNSYWLHLPYKNEDAHFFGWNSRILPPNNGFNFFRFITLSYKRKL